MLSLVEHKKRFIASKPGIIATLLTLLLAWDQTIDPLNIKQHNRSSYNSNNGHHFTTDVVHDFLTAVNDRIKSPYKKGTRILLFNIFSEKML